MKRSQCLEKFDRAILDAYSFIVAPQNYISVTVIVKQNLMSTR